MFDKFKREFEGSRKYKLDLIAKESFGAWEEEKKEEGFTIESIVDIDGNYLVLYSK